VADEENQFLATGPREASSNPPSYPDFAAFATAWTDPPFEYGVNVEGQKCGVYASTLHGGDRQPQADLVDAGVCGLGHSTGVVGVGSRPQDEEGRPRGHGIGVRGRCHGFPHGEGVRGEGEDRGVVGVAFSRRRPVSIGVLGSVKGEPDATLPKELEARGGDAGVVGLGVAGTGVMGWSTGGGTGVMGWSTGAGSAVVGRSTGDGQAGVFSSKRAAQLYLEPGMTRPPREGSAGDLLVTTGAVPTRLPEAKLWFCTRSNDGTTVPAVWKQIA
jgi:hypothetical protein